MYTKYRKPYNNYYNKQETEYNYVYHDIEMHIDEIERNIIYAGLQNYKFIMSCKDIKKGFVNAPGYEDGEDLKIFITNGDNPIKILELTIDNSEELVSEFGIAVNPEDIKESGYDLNYDIVSVE